MKELTKFAYNCLTEKDNQTYSLQKVLYASVVVAYIALSITDVVRTKDFEYQPFALGGAALLAAGGAGIGLQINSESKSKEEQNAPSI